MIKVYIDENFAHQLADGLDVFQQHLNHKEKNQFQVLSIKRVFGQGALDEEWIPIAGKERAIVITQDLRIQTTRHQCELYKEYGLGVFFFKPPSNGYSFWEMVEQVIRRWAEIKKKSKAKRPFAFRYKNKGQIEELK
ncbi:hypothetical protein LCL86_13920 [Muricauda ruestringensis]|jgi:hypothetical protein|uniref:PIN-like domain-containing protein n=1 Tax=Flagellimonas ruestringensis TaxID=111501 RepID=UPI001CD43606|nr:hypothetical protein [Allomuricauda ruestringensis]MCA0960150.1 hypothetical protein [Allomuricauda ruestringensis]